ncbi:MAG: hypothetical protein QXG39_05855 [Candidatus Aenigmatarchaeota archaeon]
MSSKEPKEEYEIIPLSPLRKLEKRVEKLESISPAVDLKEIFKEVVDVLRMNQQIVNEISKSNDALRLELSKLTIKLEDLSNKLNEFLNYIRVAASEEVYQPENEVTRSLAGKINELIESSKKIAQSNDIMISILEEIEKKLSRPVPPVLPVKKPIQRM